MRAKYTCISFSKKILVLRFSIISTRRLYFSSDMIRILIIVIILISSSAGFGQINLDSLHRELTRVTESEKVDLLVEISFSYRTTSPDSVLKYAENAMALAQKLSYSLGIAKSYWAKGMAKSLINQYDSALLFYQKALNTTLPEGSNRTLDADINMAIGGVYYNIGQLDKAIEKFIYTANIYEELGQMKSLAPVYSNIGIIMNANNQDVEAQMYFNKALKLANTYNLLGTKLPVLANMSVLFQKQELYDSAIFYANNCYKLSKLNDMTYGMAKALMILSESYSSLELFQQGLNSAKEGALLFDEMDSQRSHRSMLYRKAIALKGLGRNNEAIGISLMLLDQVETDENLKEFIYLLLYELYEATGKPLEALAYYKLYFEEYKAYELKKGKEEILELETKYNTEKKTREIEQLKNKTELQKLEIQQQYWLIGGAVLFFSILVLIIILFYRQRGLKKENQMLGLEQRFLRFQMNPHFIFNSLGAIQKFTLTNNPIESASFISKFSSLIRQVLEHSREEYITLEKEVESLKNYLDLQKLRFEDSFDYTIEVEDTIDQELMEIPPMFAQPFIENALEHGISTLDKRGKIIVTFDKAENNIRLTITDNGKGLENLTPQSQDHISLATTITKDRIEKFGTLGKEVNLTIENIEDNVGNISGVRVSLLLPTNLSST